MSKLLINESPMMFSPTLAVELDNDVNAAIFMQQLHFWLSYSQVEHDGKYWVYNTQEECVNLMRGIISISTVKRIVKKLIDRNLIITAELHTNKWNHTNYFTINYEELEKIDAKYTSNPCVSDQVKMNQSISSERTNRLDQNEPIDRVKVNQSLHKNTTEEYIQNTTDDQFNDFWKTVPNKDGKKAAEKAFKTAIKKTNLENLITAYKAYIKICDKQSRFKKNPSTWLNGECWNDDSIQAELKNLTSPEKQETQGAGFTFQLPTKPKGFLGGNQ
ncbi:hypothetical protein [Acinetobacter nectaris]|uniref:hypothetical protein n=1 Tax=Acinetobacter nectaris TaxID=1219382 RepID=UPI001F25E962|nr:hypothetical protein [Acinetobacter nectaris]MCF9034405.1 hypothetical protein [Acinetobacter nectaris]